MMTIDWVARELIADSTVRRNFRVIFPDGERADLTSADVVDDTVRLTESVCSETVFKFGCCERSMIEFEAVGVENILGCRIRCAIEFDTSGLTANRLTSLINDIANSQCDGEVVAAEASDLGWGFWRMPYGEFWVTACPRDHSQRQRRAVQAYTADPTVISEMERVRLNTYIPAYNSFSSTLRPLAAANIGYQLPGVFSAWGWVEEEDMYGHNYSWTDIQSAGAAASASFSSTADGHTYTVAISGTYALLDWNRTYVRNPPYPAATHPCFVDMSGWDSDEAWTWYQGVFEAAGAPLPTEAAHTRTARSWLQPHITYDKLDQFGPYDHAPVYWLPDGGCPFFLAQFLATSYNCNSAVRLMWSLTATFSVDGVQQEQKTFFPLSGLTARIGGYRLPGSTSYPDFTFESKNEYTASGSSYYSFTGIYDPVDVLSQELESMGREVKFDRHGVPWLRHLRDNGSYPTPPAIPASAVEELFWDDADISPIGQVQFQKTVGWYGSGGDWEDQVIWDVENSPNGGRSIYSAPNNMVFLKWNGNDPGNTWARHFIRDYVPSKAIIPYNGVVHDQPWLEPGDYVDIATGDEETPTLHICILTQTISGVQDLRQEIGATGGTVFFEGNAFGKDVTMIFGAASGGGAAGGQQASSGGGGGGGGVQQGTFTKTDSATILGGNTGIWHDGHVAQLVIGANRTGSSYPANTYTLIATIDPKPRTDISTVVTSPNGVATMVYVTTSGNVSIYPYGAAATGWIRTSLMVFI